MSEKTYGLFPAKNKEKFIGDLEKNGANIILFPPFTVEKNDLEESFTENLQNFDWIIFTDTFAADIFLEMLKETDFDLYEFDNFRVLAAGEAVADRLRFEQVHSDIIPTKLSAESIFQAISDYEIKLTDVKFLVIKESEREVELTKILKNADAEISETAVYKLTFEAELPKTKALIKGGAIDKIVFASPEELTAFQKIFVPESLSEVLRETEVSATNEVTRKSLWENGL